GNGSTWPGHIALSVNKNFIKDILKTNDKRLKIILVAGTNGKTTTGKLIQTILEKNGKKVFQNQAGANLLNGIASTLVLHSTVVGSLNSDFAILEIDENTLPLILKELTPDYLIILNLFRDQLDRYGEVNTIATKWKDALKKLSSKTKLILNADDPQIASLAFKQNDHISKAIPIPYRKRSYDQVFYFGIDSKNKAEKIQHASDSTYCPHCGEKLIYNFVHFSHLGDWKCKKCGFKHPEKIFTLSPIYPLSGAYNEYNANAASLVAKEIGMSEDKIKNALQDFKPAFGRQEILNIDGKKVQIFLSKNPTGFNESLKTIADLNAPARHARLQGVAGGKNLLIVLNDRIPDGRDVSWIWDVDFEDYKFKNLTISGDRAYDMGLRIKYTQPMIHDSLFIIQDDLKKAIVLSLEKTPKSETLYILPTYSAMLEVRKILTGKKIL
ncbi:MAG: Mur ligase family protein, partial [Candidatus Parcubacteria bacterium]|nr:Mur ligase family protein [Candidatus Parcubacteria bacterium]